MKDVSHCVKGILDAKSVDDTRTIDEEIYELLPDIKQATIRSLLSRMVKSSIVIKDNSQYIANKNDFVA